jgi:hypothetical protein
MAAGRGSSGVEGDASAAACRREGALEAAAETGADLAPGTRQPAGVAGDAAAVATAALLPAVLDAAAAGASASGVSPSTAMPATCTDVVSM